MARAVAALPESELRGESDELQMTRVELNGTAVTDKVRDNAHRGQRLDVAPDFMAFVAGRNYDSREHQLINGNPSDQKVSSGR